MRFCVKVKDCPVGVPFVPKEVCVDGAEAHLWELLKNVVKAVPEAWIFDVDLRITAQCAVPMDETEDV